MLFRFRLLLLVAVLIAVCAAAQSSPLQVRINDPGCRCDEEGATDSANICTHASSIDLSGWAGLQVLPIGLDVEQVEFRYVPYPIEGRIRIDVTTAATRARLEGPADINRDWSAATITINGVTIHGGANEAATIANINARTENTGVTASVSSDHHLVLTQNESGWDCKIVVTNGASLYGYPTGYAWGWNAEATVTHEDGTPVTDALWDFGTGRELKDSFGNAVQLTKAAAEVVGDKGTQIEVSLQDLTAVNWTNRTNGATGPCTGANLWQVQGIPLDLGENIIVVSASDSAGNTGSFQISVDRYGGVTILSPTSKPAYNSHNDTIDLSGESGFRDQPAVIGVAVNPAVVSGDFSNCVLGENDQISVNIIQPAWNATLTATVPFGAMPGTGKMIVNGVSVPIGQTVPEMIMSFDRHIRETGVGARPDAEGRFVLRSVYPGSASRIEVSNATGVLGFDTACVVGTDAIAEVTDLSGQSISDGLWAGGLGATLKDSFGDSIVLDKTAASSTGNLGVAFITQLSDAAVLTWANADTGQTGPCTGVKNWATDNVPLVEGLNRISVTARDGGGALGRGELFATRYLPYGSIGAAIRDGHTYVSLTDQVVTHGHPGSQETVYIEDPGRTSGIPVWGLFAERGDKVTVDGEIWAYPDGPVMLAWEAAKTGTGSVQPLGMGTKALAEIDSDMRISGLLVRAWGKVKPTGVLDNSFAIDDGSGTPILCRLPTSVPFNESWRFVGVTGIAEVAYNGQRLIVIRDKDDVVPF